MNEQRLAALIGKQHVRDYNSDDPMFVAVKLIEAVVQEGVEKLGKIVKDAADQIATASVLAENSAKAKAEAAVTEAAIWAAEHIKAAGVDAGKLAAGPVEAALERAELAARMATVSAWVCSGCAVAAAAVVVMVFLR